ncbi:MAG: twin-arginine translocase subunit TatC [Anaerolineae bacterium]|jgi:sec-independent protein translocase protein TatC|nr:twin-arginine translocase subunit TatC [Anaerolineae bacterium]MBT7602217.1 twin-arginine translocase subunit TatC [Anaerolineae bacterium]MBT7776089.1 twin-arginine translocase subunit TatC [Anaerolineae bacterium]
MLKVFKKLWLVISAPFRFLFWLLRLPFQSYKRIHEFLNETPDEQSLIDTTVSIFNDDDARSSFFGQIESLRKYLFRMLLGLIVTVSVSFLFTQNLLTYLAKPVPGGIDALKAIEVTESIGVFMRIALLSGFAIALPYIFFELWLFVAPALMPRSKKFGLLGIPLATLLFIGGASFAYYIMMPAALPFLLNFMGFQAELRPHSYFTFITGVMFWIGMAFEFPLIIYILTAMGFVKPQVLKEQWRLALVLIAIISAAITPTVDPVNMALVMLPMSLLYFISIGLSYIAFSEREKQKVHA